MEKKDIYVFLNSGEMFKSIYFKKEQHSDIKSMFEDLTGIFELDKDKVFNKDNWNSFWLEIIHDFIESEPKQITPNLKIKTDWEDNNYLLNIEYKDTVYKVVRYKHRGNIETFENVKTHKLITLDEYLSILQEVF